ncbi:MAG: hypothetical protein QOE41_4692, partial [Mycobacterium sp.]|nr:hypothetical protein [Mycobacterium sp.]
CTGTPGHVELLRQLVNGNHPDVIVSEGGEHRRHAHTA